MLRARPICRSSNSELRRPALDAAQRKPCAVWNLKLLPALAVSLWEPNTCKNRGKCTTLSEIVHNVRFSLGMYDFFGIILLLGPKKQAAMYDFFIHDVRLSPGCMSKSDITYGREIFQYRNILQACVYHWKVGASKDQACDYRSTIRRDKAIDYVRSSHTQRTS